MAAPSSCIRRRTHYDGARLRRARDLKPNTMKGFIIGLIVGVAMSATLSYGLNLTDDLPTIPAGVQGVLMCWDQTANGKLNAILKKLDIRDWTTPTDPKR